MRKKVELGEIRIVCWSDEVDVRSESCMAGFVVDESKSFLKIASTKGVGDFSDIISLDKKLIISIKNVGGNIK